MANPMDQYYQQLGALNTTMTQFRAEDQQATRDAEARRRYDQEYAMKAAQEARNIEQYNMAKAEQDRALKFRGDLTTAATTQPDANREEYVTKPPSNKESVEFIRNNMSRLALFYPDKAEDIHKAMSNLDKVDSYTVEKIKKAQEDIYGLAAKYGIKQAAEMLRMENEKAVQAGKEPMYPESSITDLLKLEQVQVNEIVDKAGKPITNAVKPFGEATQYKDPNKTTPDTDYIQTTGADLMKRFPNKFRGLEPGAYYSYEVGKNGAGPTGQYGKTYIAPRGDGSGDKDKIVKVPVGLKLRELDAKGNRINFTPTQQSDVKVLNEAAGWLIGSGQKPKYYSSSKIGVTLLAPQFYQLSAGPDGTTYADLLNNQTTEAGRDKVIMQMSKDKRINKSPYFVETHIRPDDLTQESYANQAFQAVPTFGE